jgi:hypothetical protein
MGQVLLGRESMVKESFSDAQMSPGAAMGIDLSATGATHNDPDPCSGDSVGHNIATIMIAKSFGFILEPHELLILFLDFGGEAAAMELDADGVAEGDLGGVTKDGAGGIGGDGVAALEDAQRAALFELQAKAIETFALGAKEAFGAEA